MGECKRCKHLILCTLLARGVNPLTQKKLEEVCKKAGGFKEK